MSPPGTRPQIAAVAPGFALAWVEAGSLLKGDERSCGWSATTCRSAAGWSIRRAGRSPARRSGSARIATVKDGVDLDAMLASGELDNEQTAAWYGDYHGKTWPGGSNTWTTDADGRFEVRGVGRDRIASLIIQGPMMADSHALCYGPADEDSAEAAPAANAAEQGLDVHTAVLPARCSSARHSSTSSVRPSRSPASSGRRRRASRSKGSGSSARRERPGRRSRPGPMRRAASVSSACPRARSIKSPPTKDTGPSLRSSVPGSRSPTPRVSSRSRRRLSCPAGWPSPAA